MIAKSWENDKTRGIWPLWFVAQSVSGCTLLMLVGYVAYPVLARIGYMPRGWNLDEVTRMDTAKAGLFVLVLSGVVAFVATFVLRRFSRLRILFPPGGVWSWLLAEFAGSCLAVLAYGRILNEARTPLVFVPELQSQIWAFTLALFAGTVAGCFSNILHGPLSSPSS